jgi:hypothetical protein
MSLLHHWLRHMAYGCCPRPHDSLRQEGSSSTRARSQHVPDAQEKERQAQTTHEVVLDCCMNGQSIQCCCFPFFRRLFLCPSLRSAHGPAVWATQTTKGEMSSPPAAAAASVSAMSASVAEHRASSRAATTPSAGTAAAAGASASVAASAGQAPPTADSHPRSTSSVRPRGEYSMFASGGPSGLPPAGLRWSSSEMELSNLHRVCSATIGSFLTSLVVTPFGT